MGVLGCRLDGLTAVYSVGADGWFIVPCEGVPGGLGPFKRGLAGFLGIFSAIGGSKILVFPLLLDVLEGLERSGRLIARLSCYFRPDPT